MKEATHRLGGASRCREGLAAARIGDQLTIAPQAAGEVHFLDAAGRVVGTLTARHEVARLIADGGKVLHCTANSVYMPDPSRPHGSINVRVAIGAEGETFELPPVREPRSYPVAIVGESFYQSAISRLSIGAPVTLYRETGNPHDEHAIVVKAAGATIGHLARDSWLRRAILEEGWGALATIMALERGGAASGVVLQVKLVSDELGEVPYPRPTNWLSRLLK